MGGWEYTQSEPFYHAYSGLAYRIYIVSFAQGWGLEVGGLEMVDGS